MTRISNPSPNKPKKDLDSKILNKGYLSNREPTTNINNLGIISERV
jgi:hypothetical protein